MTEYLNTDDRKVSFDELEDVLTTVSLILTGANLSLEKIMCDVDLSESLYPHLNLLRAGLERAGTQIIELIPNARLIGSQ